MSKLTKIRNCISARSALNGDAGGLSLDAGGGHNDSRYLDQLGHSLAGQVTQSLADLSATKSHLVKYNSYLYILH